MKKTIFKAESRGEADYGWLKTHYSFSFANYYNPQCINFGALRVLNDDIIEGGKGFPMHPHDNMEIITIPLEGALAHQDSMGSSSVIKAGDIQIMSAGSGIIHSEFNHSRDKEVSLLQIWIFPRTKNIKPRYDQKSYKSEDYKEQLKCVVAPALKNGELLINQDAWLSMGEFSSGKSVIYEMQNKNNGVYIFLIEGKAQILETELNKRDAVGIWDVGSVDITFQDNSKLLIIEVPMD